MDPISIRVPTKQPPVSVGVTAPGASVKVGKPSLGTPGVGINHAYVDRDTNTLKIVLTDNRVIDAGLVSPRVERAYYNAQREFVLVYEDGVEVNVGVPDGLNDVVGLTALSDDPNPTLSGNLNLNGYGLSPQEGQQLVFDGGYIP